jgi:hypothetical protein
VSEPTPALYVPDGDRFVPTDYTRGPWDRHAQHGGPPAALLAECLDRVEAPQPMQVARLTVELLRPVPIEPLRVETSVLRPGRKVQLAAATLWAAGVEVARATALRIRVADVPMPSDLTPEPAVAPSNPRRSQRSPCSSSTAGIPSVSTRCMGSSMPRSASAACTVSICRTFMTSIEARPPPMTMAPSGIS